MGQASDRLYEKFNDAKSYANEYFERKAMMAQLDLEVYKSKVIDGSLLLAGGLCVDYWAFYHPLTSSPVSLGGYVIPTDWILNIFAPLWVTFYSLNTLRILSKGQNPCVNSPCTNLPIPKALRKK
jgi:hypothetical protein